MPRDQAAVLPGTVQVRFRPYPCGELAWDDLPTTFTLTTKLADVGSGSDPDNESGGDNGGNSPLGPGSEATHSIRDTCHAIFTAAGGEPNNLAALQALTDQIGLDFWRWRSVAFDRVYNGVVTPTPDGLIDTLTWTYRADDCSTRVCSAPIGGEVGVMEHSDPEHDCDASPKIYGGTTHAAVAGGILTLPKISLRVVDGVLQWSKLTPDTATICPNVNSGSMAMTTESGTSMMTE